MWQYKFMQVKHAKESFHVLSMPGKHKAICMQNICVQLLHEGGIRIYTTVGSKMLLFNRFNAHKRIMCTVSPYKVTLLKPDQLEGLKFWHQQLDDIVWWCFEW